MPIGRERPWATTRVRKSSAAANPPPLTIAATPIAPHRRHTLPRAPSFLVAHRSRAPIARLLTRGNSAAPPKGSARRKKTTTDRSLATYTEPRSRAMSDALIEKRERFERTALPFL